MARARDLSPNQLQLVEALMKATWRGKGWRDSHRTGPRKRRPRWRPGMNKRGPAPRTGPLRHYTAGEWRALAMNYCCDLDKAAAGWRADLQTWTHHPGPYHNVRNEKWHKTKRTALEDVVRQMVDDERERPALLRRTIRQMRAQLRELEAELAALSD